MGIRRIHHNPKYTYEAQKHVVQNTELCFVPDFHFALTSYAVGSESTHTGLKLELYRWIGLKTGLEHTTIEVPDKALLGFRGARSVLPCRIRGLKINHIWDHTWGAVSGSGLPSTRKTWAYWTESSNGPQDNQLIGASLIWRGAERAMSV